MTKQEQFRQNEINELAYVLDKAKLDAISTIGSLNNGFGQWYAKAAYNAGYRKIDDTCAVITKDDLNLYKKQAVKDTAKEICDLILEHWKEKQFVECDWLRVEIAEKYGVEVE